MVGGKANVMASSAGFRRITFRSSTIFSPSAKSMLKQKQLIVMMQTWINEFAFYLLNIILIRTATLECSSNGYNLIFIRTLAQLMQGVGGSLLF